MSIWLEEIVRRDSHGQERWYIVGYYLEETLAYAAEESAWNQRQDEGLNRHFSAMLALGLDVYHSDDFSSNVTTPHWYLHKDGTWQKLLSQRIHYPDLMEGEYLSREAAEQALVDFPAKPPRFEGYLEYLRSAPPPIVCQQYGRAEPKLAWKSVGF